MASAGAESRDKRVERLLRVSGGAEAAPALPSPATPTPATAPAAQVPSPTPAASPVDSQDERVKRLLALDAGEDPRVVAADNESGAPLLDRLAAAFKFDKPGVANYLKEKYGPENVLTGRDGEIYFRPESEAAKPAEQQRLVRFNPKGFDFGDIVEYVPATAAGLLGGAAAAGAAALGAAPATALGAAVGVGALADVGLQGIGAALPGEENVPIEDRATRAAIGGASELLGPAVGAVGRAARPLLKAQPAQAAREFVGDLGKQVARGAKAAVRPLLGDADKIAESQALRTRTGVPFSAGQQSESPAVNTIEGLLRRTFTTSNIVREADEKRISKLAEFADRSIARLGVGGRTRATERARSSTLAYLRALQKTRDQNWSKGMNEIEKMAGDQPIFELKNMRREIEKLIAENSAPGSTGARQSLVGSLKKRLGEVTPEITPEQKALIESGELTPSEIPQEVAVTAREFKNLLADWSEASFDPRNAFEQVENSKIQKYAASRIMNALRRDLDAVADSERGDVAARLQSVRKDFADASRVIDEALAHPLTEAIKKKNALVQPFLSNSDPEELARTVGFLQSIDAKGADELRAAVFQEVLRKSAASGATDAPFSPLKIATLARKNKEQFKALFEGNPAGYAAFNDFVAASRKLADRAGTDGSPTQPLQLAMDFVKSLVGGGLFASALVDPSSAVPEAASLAGLIFGPRALARALNDPRILRHYALVMKAASGTPAQKQAARSARAAAAKKGVGRKSKPATAGVRQAVADIVAFQQRLQDEAPVEPEGEE